MLFSSMKGWSSGHWKQFLINHFMIIIGSFLCAFGTAIFCTKLNIVAGGLSGIGIIIQHVLNTDSTVIDIVVWVLTAILWVVSFFAIGKRFAARTLISSILFPLFLTLCLRVEAFKKFATDAAGDGEVGNILFCALFSGVFQGAGVALTFLGKGSTGGVDVLIVIIANKTKMKESYVSFIIDAIIVGASMIFINDNIVNSLCGFLSIGITAAMIEFVYLGAEASYQVDVISDHWEEISRFAQDVLGRGATIIHAQGGYKGEERIIVRVVFEKWQYDKIRKFIYQVDPKAFITFTMTNAVYGEGFKKNSK